MKKITIILVLLGLFSWSTLSAQENVYGFTLADIDGKEVSLADYRGQVLLLVNVASKCGLTPQYQGLQELFEKYREKGFFVLAFPANDFRNQEPGSDIEIKEFCTSNYGVTFPLFAKISVLGEDIHPLYRMLTSGAGRPELAGDIRWNFDKFLIDRLGRPVARFAPRASPTDPDLLAALEKLLAE